MVPIPSLEGQYAATRDGKIWSRKTKKFIAMQKIYSGYMKVDLSFYGRKTPRFVHRLVAEAYLKNPEGKKEVHHLNAIRHDNRVDNLCWATREENNQAAWDSGNKKFIRTKKFDQNIKKAFKAAMKARGL